jgi:hypothetical protein
MLGLVVCFCLLTFRLVDDCRTFFSLVQSLLSMIGNQEGIDLLLYIVLIVNILRIIQCTSLHPRLASLTGTLSEALDDLWHTTIHIFLVLGLFAAVGTWRFGSTRKEFESIQASFSTELNMMFSGGFIDNWDETLDLQAFTLLFLILVVLLILNFLLANIIDAFDKIQRHKQELEIEQNFFSDIFWVMVSRIYQYREKWPESRVLAAKLGRLKAKFNVSFDHLKNTKLFESGGYKSIYSFMLYYRDFDFLNPIQVTKFGKLPNPSTEKQPNTISEKQMYEMRKTNYYCSMDLNSNLLCSGVSLPDIVASEEVNQNFQVEKQDSQNVDMSESLRHQKCHEALSPALCFVQDGFVRDVKWNALPANQDDIKKL